MDKTFATRSLIILTAFLAVACGPREPVSRAPAEGPPADAPVDAVEYRLIPGESEIRILAYRDGPLARLGHNHVISTTTVEGEVRLASPVTRSSVSLAFPVGSLQVDIPAQRAEEGDEFPGELEPSAVIGTRSNMLGDKVLDAERFPRVTLRSREIAGELPALSVTLDVDVRGRVSSITIPVDVMLGDQQIEASGRATLRQTDLGLEPFSIGLGALSVRDALELKFRFVARAAS